MDFTEKYPHTYIGNVNCKNTNQKSPGINGKETKINPDL